MSAAGVEVGATFAQVAPSGRTSAERHSGAERRRLQPDVPRPRGETVDAGGLNPPNAAGPPYVSGNVGSTPTGATRCPNGRPAWWMPAHHHCALDHELRRYPGITCEDYWRLLERQGGVCATCGRPPQAGRWRFAADRDHETGEIRGLLHHRCNRWLTKDRVRERGRRLRTLRAYLADPPGRALGLAASPAAVQRAEERKRKRRQAARERRAKDRRQAPDTSATSAGGVAAAIGKLERKGT